jgi:thymidylate synthase
MREERLMDVVRVIGVNEGYSRGMALLANCGLRESSRVGDVLVTAWPVTTSYERPQERVLMSPSRDANPFFHLMESVWMLGGSNDGKWLDRYVSDFSSRFAESDGNIHGAYGYRWRYLFGGLMGIDQITKIGKMIFDDPTTRRCVLSMWDPQQDLGASVRDMPCNTHVYFRGRDGVLDMTVCCRSNDIIWGCYGSNMVHFSILGEVMAGLAGLEQGMYYQVSNNYHAYCEVFDRMIHSVDHEANPYENSEVVPYSIISYSDRTQRRMEAERVLKDAVHFLSMRDALAEHNHSNFVPDSDWFRDVIIPMHMTHTAWRNRDVSSAMEWAKLIVATDWRRAATEWMQRRLEKRS